MPELTYFKKRRPIGGEDLSKARYSYSPLEVISSQIENQNPAIFNNYEHRLYYSSLDQRDRMALTSGSQGTMNTMMSGYKRGRNPLF